MVRDNASEWNDADDDGELWALSDCEDWAHGQIGGDRESARLGNSM